MNWGRIVRDALLIMLITALGGFLIGVFAASRGDKSSMAAIAVSNIGLATIGFAISGSLTRANRVRHLLSVAALVWLLSLANVAFGISLAQWAASAIAILFSCGVGGAISALMFRRTPNESLPSQ